MVKTLLFSIAVFFCFGVCNISANEVNGEDVAISQTERINSILVDKAENEDWFNGYELEAVGADECKCENGKCMRACDVKKNIPCKDKKQVCVCNPEFAYYDGKCEYCDCGQGFNCTISQTIYGVKQKNCICPLIGYYEDRSSSKCRVECSPWRRCQNGGTCGSNNRCNCGYVARGDLCEEVIKCNSMCENRFEVDCLYDQLHQVAYCSCKNSSLFYDQEAGICIPCPCENGYCDYEFDLFDRKLRCNCPRGYSKYNGYCKECDCGYGGDVNCYFDYKGEKICKCFDGFYEREGSCHSCECFSSMDTETKCEVTGNVKRCFCKDGYKDNLGDCVDINECETNNTCHPSATCYNKMGSFECRCPDGYKGRNYDEIVEPGQVCEDIDECKESIHACWYWDAKCVNLPGSYKCECLKGFEPSSYFEEPHKTRCVPTKKNLGPSMIVVGITVILLAVSCCVHIRVKKRAISSN